MYNIVENLNECQVKIYSNLSLEDVLAQGDLLQSIGKNIKIVRSSSL